MGFYGVYRPHRPDPAVSEIFWVRAVVLIGVGMRFPDHRPTNGDSPLIPPGLHLIDLAILDMDSADLAGRNHRVISINIGPLRL
jgi:hypothetical protein